MPASDMLRPPNTATPKRQRAPKNAQTTKQSRAPTLPLRNRNGCPFSTSALGTSSSAFSSTYPNPLERPVCLSQMSWTSLTLTCHKASWLISRIAEHKSKKESRQPHNSSWLHIYLGDFLKKAFDVLLSAFDLKL